MMSPDDSASRSNARLPTDIIVGWFDLDALDRAFDNKTPSLADCRVFLKTSTERLMTRFDEGADIEDLIFARSWLIDQVLIRCWQAKLATLDGALVAVGGYGRAELLPGSDIDIMVLLAQTEESETAEALEAFLMLLWDIGLEVGHSVRTLEDCQDQARADITVATNLMESRLLYGREDLFDDMRRLTGSDHVWPDRDFFTAKLDEQRARYKKFDDAVYNLEPNVKEGPGGLRDAQMIGWVFKRHFGTEDLGELVEREDITPGEYVTLMQGQRFLWRVRFGLHEITGRREDRLLFDHQRTLAEHFGYTDHDHKLAVEWFMRDYYLNIQALSRLNEMLLQLLQEIILYEGEQDKTTPLNRRFRVNKGFLEVTGNGIFKRYPFALLELFLLMQQHSEIKGVRASTIRLVRDHLHLIDDKFRQDIRARSLFMEIFRQSRGLTHELRRMNRYGVLAAYYPVFENIVGQMQHDLFHAYTVDEHTLFVVRNLRRFSVPKLAHEFPLCSRISGEIPKPELLYLAGFFHDIAKGRGGDHAELGADDAYAFLQQHGLSEYDCNLVSWLVRSHLLMSQVAQRRDITDPDVIHEFASQIGDTTRLDYLYLLTVADIRGTNPTLWNSWKDALLRDLYNATRRALQRGLENPLHRNELIRDIKNRAAEKLAEFDVDPQQLNALWQDLPDDYFLRHSVDEVVWHGKVILEAGNIEGVRVDLCPQSERGGSALFLYTPVIDRLFNRTTALIDQMGLTITDARIITTERGYAINTYLLLNSAGEPVPEGYDSEELVTLMKKELLSQGSGTTATARRAPRRIRHFHVATNVNFHTDDARQRTIVELFTTDYPGLLSRVGQIFYKQGVLLHNAKIATFGAKAEDVFYVTGKNDKPLDEAAMQALRDALIETLDDTDDHPDTY